MNLNSEQQRYFDNPYDDYVAGQSVETVDREAILNLIAKYVQNILTNQHQWELDADLYVGYAGIAYMFLCLWQSPHIPAEWNAKQSAESIIHEARHMPFTRRTDLPAFLCGSAGIHAVSAVISAKSLDRAQMGADLTKFLAGFDVARELNFHRSGSDELLVGRAGFLSACYWLNEQIQPPPIDAQPIRDICEIVVKSGRQYSLEHRSSLPLMYQYHKTEYLGAAHGVASILHMLLESPWFQRTDGDKEFRNIKAATLVDIKRSIDAFVGKFRLISLKLLSINLYCAALQAADGNFPSSMERMGAANGDDEYALVHWCHGAPGAIYLLAKAYRLFGDEKYLAACHRAADLVWRKGLLRKGPGICHGIAGNAYVFLLMYRLTGGSPKYLYRAECFRRFLESEQFVREARQPDRPFSLYEGLAGTVCFLVDMLDVNRASFPFMDVFSRN